MDKKAVVEFFGNQSKTAIRLGVTKSAVSQWGDLVPEHIAYRAQYESGGVLKVDPATYRREQTNVGGLGTESVSG